MKLLIYSTFILLAACTTTQETNNTTKATDEEVLIDSTKEVTFDSTLAKQFGADQYGMKPYVIAFLKTGPNPAKDSAHSAELQAAHMANIGRLADEGKLVLAGPFYGDNKGEFRGIYLFNTSSLDSAKVYTESDPAIQYGIFIMELKNYYGSAALMGINETHKKIAEIEI